MSGALIRFVCRKAEHQRRNTDVSNPVTLHQHEWAFCPAGLSDGHTWERIDDTTLETLRHRTVETRTKV